MEVQCPIVFGKRPGTSSDKTLVKLIGQNSMTQLDSRILSKV